MRFHALSSSITEKFTETKFVYPTNYLVSATIEAVKP